MVEGRPVRGQYQSIMLVELDGPRERTVAVQICGEKSLGSERKTPGFFNS